MTSASPENGSPLNERLFTADSSPLYSPPPISLNIAEVDSSVGSNHNPLCNRGRFVQFPDPMPSNEPRFYDDCIASKIIMTVIDDPWIKRLSEVNQSASLGYAYPSAKNARLDHSLGVAALGIKTLRRLWDGAESQGRQIISDWAEGFALALICHDLGHIAPGSHGAYRILFPGCSDTHEALACAILSRDTPLTRRLMGAYGCSHGLRIIEKACAIIAADLSRVPRFLVQLLSGDAWNVDRGDWVGRDLWSIGQVTSLECNDIIQENLLLTPHGSLAIHEAGVEALEQFAMIRSRLYWNEFSSPRCRSFDHLAWAVGECARDHAIFADELTPLMKRVFLKESPFDLDLDDLFQLREHQWLCQRDLWCESRSFELRLLAQALRDRRAPAALPIPDGVNPDDLRKFALGLVEKMGFTGKYHVSLLPRSDGADGDLDNALKVHTGRSEVIKLTDYSSYFRAMDRQAFSNPSHYLVLPEDIVPDVESVMRFGRTEMGLQENV